MATQAMTFFDFYAALEQARATVKPEQTNLIAKIALAEYRLNNTREQLEEIQDLINGGCLCQQVEGTATEGVVSFANCPIHRRLNR